MLASSTSIPFADSPAIKSAAYRQTPPTASAVMKTLLTDMRSCFELHKTLRPLLLNIAEAVETVQVCFVRALPGEIVRRTPHARVFGRAWIREQRNGLI